MSRIIRLALVITLLGAFLPAHAVLAAPNSPAGTCDSDQQQADGAWYRICMPWIWNGDLVIYAHGYVDPRAPVAIPEDQLVLPDGTSIPGVINSLGFAFATTSYSKNGLAVLQGVADVSDLVNIFKAKYRGTRFVYIVGASEGGLVTTLATERRPDLFSGGLATCGPIGSFNRQINYWGDFRVLFDYFFPGVLPGSPVDIPDYIRQDWEAVYKPAILSAIQADPHATEQLLLTARAPFDPFDMNTAGETVLGLLWYNIFATNDGKMTLGGQPFDNSHKHYFGSDDDIKLNQEVQRFSADQAALDEINAHYQTSGNLGIPLVTLHTLGDPIVPYWHEPMYRGKVIVNHSIRMYNGILAWRYGHCQFTKEEVIFSFALLVLKVTGIHLFEDGSQPPTLTVQGAGDVLFLPLMR